MNNISNAAMMGDLAAMAITGDAISHRGMMLMGYQRTKQISRKAKVAWEAGNAAVLDAEIKVRRDDVFRGTVAEIFAEYVAMRDQLRVDGMTPKRVVDIGCGAAINDVFLAKDFGCAVTLVDIEDTPGQYHLWNDAGSGYAALADAKAFLVSNGVAAAQVTTVNPRKDAKAMKAVKGDLVTSLFSCGFHYPIAEYGDLMCETVAKGGAVIIDLRLRYMDYPDEALQRLTLASKQTVLLEMAKSKRMMFHA